MRYLKNRKKHIRYFNSLLGIKVYRILNYII